MCCTPLPHKGSHQIIINNHTCADAGLDRKNHTLKKNKNTAQRGDRRNVNTFCQFPINARDREDALILSLIITRPEIQACVQERQQTNRKHHPRLVIFKMKNIRGRVKHLSNSVSTKSTANRVPLFGGYQIGRERVIKELEGETARAGCIPP